MNATQTGDPKLGSLAGNGGPTQTIALLSGSAAIANGDPTICAAPLPTGSNSPTYGAGSVDQRGLPRSISRCDIGAFEVQIGVLTLAAPTSSAHGALFNLVVTAMDVNGTLKTNYTGAVHVSSTDTQAVLPANYTFTAADNGVHTFHITLNTSGSETVTVADTVHTDVTGSTAINVTGSSIASISPDFSPPAGAAAVTIMGTGFLPDVTVKFGGPSGLTATVTNVTSTTITVIVPASTTLGKVDVVVTQAGRRSP